MELAASHSVLDTISCLCLTLHGSVARDSVRVTLPVEEDQREGPAGLPHMRILDA